MVVTILPESLTGGKKPVVIESPKVNVYDSVDVKQIPSDKVDSQSRDSFKPDRKDESHKSSADSSNKEAQKDSTFAQIK